MFLLLHLKASCISLFTCNYFLEKFDWLIDVWLWSVIIRPASVNPLLDSRVDLSIDHDKEMSCQMAGVRLDRPGKLKFILELKVKYKCLAEAPIFEVFNSKLWTYCINSSNWKRGRSEDLEEHSPHIPPSVFAVDKVNRYTIQNNIIVWPLHSGSGSSSRLSKSLYKVVEEVKKKCLLSYGETIKVSCVYVVMWLQANHYPRLAER